MTLATESAAADFTLDDEGFPTQIDAYQRLAKRDVVPLINDLGAIDFGDAETTVRIRT